MSKRPASFRQEVGHAGDLIERCTDESLRLLEACLTPQGILAARPGAAAAA
jgi:hypothetical protein